MIEHVALEERAPRMLAAGLPENEVDALMTTVQACAGTVDAGTLQQAYQQSRALLARMPLKSQRSEAEKLATKAIQHPIHEATLRYFRANATALYREITDHGRRSLRVDELVFEAAQRLPHILPTEQELEQERELLQQDKDGREIPQGLFVSAVLSDKVMGSHLMRSSLRPTKQALALLDEFTRTGRVDLGKVKIEVEGETAYVYLHNERYLNSEDDTVVGPLEVAVDLVTLHPHVRLGVLRGSVVDHPKYQGRRIFCSGINLTRIYQGKQSYLSFLYRNMMMHPKIYRGVLVNDTPESFDYPIHEPERTTEKLWVAVVDTFAIGGGCQLMLVVDHVIAEKGSYFTLPARKEGFIPGASTMRLPRFVGERAAREAILFDRRFDADTPEGRMLANEVVDSSEIEAAIARCVANVEGSGLVSAGSNRKTIRIWTEPFDQYREYMATYAYEQAFCHLSEQLIKNLERHWNAKARKL